MNEFRFQQGIIFKHDNNVLSGSYKWLQFTINMPLPYAKVTGSACSLPASKVNFCSLKACSFITVAVVIRREDTVVVSCKAVHKGTNPVAVLRG